MGKKICLQFSIGNMVFLFRFIALGIYNKETRSHESKNRGSPLDEWSKFQWKWILAYQIKTSRLPERGTNRNQNRIIHYRTRWASFVARKEWQFDKTLHGSWYSSWEGKWNRINSKLRMNIKLLARLLTLSL